MKKDLLSMASIKLSKLTLYTLGIMLIGIGMALVVQWLLTIDNIYPDFGQDYNAAQQLLAGQSIYSGHIENNHPPFSAILFIPFTQFSYLIALQIWTLISVTLYLGLGYYIVKSVGISLPKVGWIIGIGLALCWYPFHAHLAQGQISLLLVVSLIGGWSFMRRGRIYWAGILFALAVLLKLFPGLILLYLVLRKKWDTMLTTTISIGIGWILTIMVVGLEDTIYYFQIVAPRVASQYTSFPINVSATSLPNRFFTPGSWVEPIAIIPDVVPALTVISGLLLTGVLAWHIWMQPATADGDKLAFTLVCVAMPLLSPISWQHIFPILWLPFALLFAAALQSKPSNLRMYFVLFAIFLALSLPDIQLANFLMSLYTPYRMPWYTALILTLPTMAMLLLWYMLLKISSGTPREIHE